MDDKPTPQQLEVIDHIKENTGIAYQGKTKQDARNFISENITASKKASSKYKNNCYHRGVLRKKFPYRVPSGVMPAAVFDFY
jgi:hypothetical protein